MLQPFSVLLGNRLFHPQELEKIHEKSVTLPKPNGHASPLLCQNDPSIFLVNYQLLLVQPVKHTGDSRWSHMQIVCNVDGFRVPLFPYQFVDDFYIVLFAGCLLSTGRFVRVGQLCKLTLSTPGPYQDSEREGRVLPRS